MAAGMENGDFLEDGARNAPGFNIEKQSMFLQKKTF